MNKKANHFALAKVGIVALVAILGLSLVLWGNSGNTTIVMQSPGITGAVAADDACMQLSELYHDAFDCCESGLGAKKCTGLQTASEASGCGTLSCGPACQPAPTQTRDGSCTLIYGDFATQPDCADPDCAGQEIYTGSGLFCEACPEQTCNDGFDNDADGLQNCYDLDCNGKVGGPQGQLCERPAEVTCTDGFDNDVDNKVDCYDTDCSGNPVCPSSEVTCNDFADNDFDGTSDCQDSDCNGQTGPGGGVCQHGAELSCTDGFDNDGDNKMDCSDSDCAGDSSCPWQIVSTGTTQPLRDVDFVDSQNGWAVGNAGTIVHTSDGGATWNVQTSGTTQTLTRVDFVDSLNGWAAGFDGVMLHTTDGGNTWTQQSLPVISSGIAGVNGLVAINSNEAFASLMSTGIGPKGAGNQRYIVYTSNGGNTWTVTFNFGNVFAGTLPIDFVDSTRGWAGGDVGRIARSVDGGFTWNTVTSGFGGTMVDVDFVNASHGFTLTGNFPAKVLSTLDGGLTWQTSPSVQGSKLAFVDAQTGWVVGSSNVYYTSDGGLTFTAQPVGGGISAISTVNSLNVWATASDTLFAGSLWHTTSGGN